MKNLKKIIILAFNPPYLPMIQNGTKIYEFREKIGKDWEKGTEVYLAITKNFGGSGKVEAKFTIGDIWELTDRKDGTIQMDLMGCEGWDINYNSVLEPLGYSGQKYAIEIDNFEMLSEPVALKDIYAYNKVEAEMVSFGKEFINDFYSKAHQRIKKQKLAEYVVEMEGNFLSNLHYYKACKINRMPQSWCYGGVIQYD